MRKLIILMLMPLCGCVSTIYHAGNENDYPYRATSEVWSECVCVWGKPAHGVDDAMGQAYIKISYPFWLVDECGEIVVDTICLPWDIYTYNVLGN